jgi:hypothetical protein
MKNASFKPADPDQLVGFRVISSQRFECRFAAGTSLPELPVFFAGAARRHP